MATMTEDNSFTFSSFYSATPFEISEEELSNFTPGYYVCLGQFMSRLKVTEDRKYYISPLQDTKLETIVLVASRKIKITDEDGNEVTDFYKNNKVEIDPEFKVESDLIIYFNSDRSIDKNINKLLDIEVLKESINNETREKYKNINLVEVKKLCNDITNDGLKRHAKKIYDEIQSSEDNDNDSIHHKILKEVPLEVIIFLFYINK